MNGKYALESGLRAVLIDMGMSPTSVLRRAGLRADLLAGGPAWLNETEFFSLWRAIELESQDPNLPLQIDHAFAPGVSSPTVFAAMLSADLNAAASRISQYKRLIGPMRLIIDAGNDETTIGYEWPDKAEPPATLVLSELLFWVAMVRTGTRKRIEPLAIAAPEPPADVVAFRDYLGIEITQSTTQSVTFRATDASIPFVTADESLWNAFEPELKRRLRDLKVDASVSDQVRSVLIELLPTGRTTVGEVAKELAVSPRTLHRRLKGDSTTFQEILDTTREGLARHYLSDRNLSAPEISFLLGYEETSSFYRAFNNWTGETPERVRSQLV